MARVVLLLMLGICCEHIALGKGLEEPSQLKSAVKFWEKIFHTYKPGHCVLHDRDQLESIFIVKTVPTSGRQRNRAIRAYKKEVKQALMNLGRRGYAKTDLERRVVKGIPRSLRKPSYYRSAAHRVRCQRGVDIFPSLKRSQSYLPMIKKIFATKKLPADLAYLPHLESGFNKRAHSRAGARGIWQFMPFTARSMGLTVRRGVDHRSDPYRSTVAAAKHFTKLYRQTKSWPLAITAYNYGPNGVRRAMKKYGRDYMKIRKHHKTKIFGFAAKNYYPSFLAVRNVASRLDAKP